MGFCLVLGSFPALLLLALFVGGVVSDEWAWTIVPAWLVGIVAVMLWNRLASGRPPPWRT